MYSPNAWLPKPMAMTPPKARPQQIQAIVSLAAPRGVGSWSSR